MIVYPMGYEDAEEVAALEKSCFSDPWTPDNVKGSIVSPCGYCLAARNEGGIIGYLCAQIVGDEGELLRIATANRLRGHGIGSELLNRMLEDNPGVRIWRLDVRCGNEAAIRLYEKTGFAVVTRNKDFYREPAEDGFLMARELC